jgi:hypothetical protein
MALERLVCPLQQLLGDEAVEAGNHHGKLVLRVSGHGARVDAARDPLQVLGD